MGVGLPPLEFTECLIDSPVFRDNLHKHEKELENTNQQIKRLIKEVKDLLQAANQLSTCQRNFAESLDRFTFECIGGNQTDDERVISKSLQEFSKLINNIEDERARMLENADRQVLTPLETFRKTHIGRVKNGKKKFEKQTAKFCQCQERYLNLTTKKQNDSVLKEADASVDMAERHFYNASMDYVYLIQEVHELKKFEFVETLLGFMIGWLTFYHQGYEVAKDFNPYKGDLQLRIQRTRENFEDYSSKLRGRMAEIQKQKDPVKKFKGTKEGYLFLLEKKAFGQTWTKHFCTYDKETNKFTLLPYNQVAGKPAGRPEVLHLSMCTRRPSDSIDKRFCFDLEVNSKPGVLLTFQALSEADRKAWLDIMDGREPTYLHPSVTVKAQNGEEQRVLDDTGVQFVKRCIEVLERRGLEEQGLYRVVGVASKVTKLLQMGLDKRKSEKLSNLDNSLEWETKTITSALKSYLRNLPEPLMTHRYHNDFIDAVKNDHRVARVNQVHKLVYKIPKNNFLILKILIEHLTKVAAKCDKNLMTVSNLGVCFGPTLLRPEEETVASIVDLKFYNVVVEILIDNYLKIFTKEPDPNAILPQPTISQTNLPKPQPEYQNAALYFSHQQQQLVHNNQPDLYSSAPKLAASNNQQPSQQLTIRTYYEPPPGLSASLYNVHEPSNGGPNLSTYLMSTSEHSGQSNGAPATASNLHHQKVLAQRFSNSTSQSDSNIADLQTYIPQFRNYGRLENSPSSSNESVSSNSRDDGGGNSITPTYQQLLKAPQKRTRTAIGMSVPKSYRAQGSVGINDASVIGASNIITNITSPTFFGLRRVRTLYACFGEHDGELSFEPNQIITNVKTSQEPGWLEGTLNGKTGLVPENYVEVLP